MFYYVPFPIIYVSVVIYYWGICSGITINLGLQKREEINKININNLYFKIFRNSLVFVRTAIFPLPISFVNFSTTFSFYHPLQFFFKFF